MKCWALIGALLVVGAAPGCDEKGGGTPKPPAADADAGGTTPDTSGAKPDASLDEAACSGGVCSVPQNALAPSPAPKWLSHTLTSGSFADDKATHTWSIPAGAQTPDPACSAPDANLYGDSYEWKGFEFDGETWTCNRCPGGTGWLQGSWNYTFYGENVCAVSPVWRDLLIVDGNRWYERQEVDGKEVILEGWYFCGSKPEIENQTTQFVVTAVNAVDGDAMGWEVGQVFSADVLAGSETAPATFAWLFYFTVVTVNGPGYDSQPEWCRVCEDVGGRTCPNPYP